MKFAILTLLIAASSATSFAADASKTVGRCALSDAGNSSAQVELIGQSLSVIDKVVLSTESRSTPAEDQEGLTSLESDRVSLNVATICFVSSSEETATLIGLPDAPGEAKILKVVTDADGKITSCTLTK